MSEIEKAIRWFESRKSIILGDKCSQAENIALKALQEIRSTGLTVTEITALQAENVTLKKVLSEINDLAVGFQEEGNDAFTFSEKVYDLSLLKKYSREKTKRPPCFHSVPKTQKCAGIEIDGKLSHT